MALESSKDSDIWLPLLPNGGVLLCWKEKTLQCFRKSCENNNEENSKTYQWQCIAKATFFWPPCCVTNLQTNWRPTKNNVSGTSQQDNPVSNRIEAEHCSFCCSCGTKLTVQLYPKKLLEISVVYGNLEEHGHFSSEVFYPTFLFELPISGHWYGGAHSLRQFWPTERACLELGPYYPFDNGPQGLCGLVDPSWVSSKGLVLSVDPFHSKFLHIGLHSPKQQQQASRQWNIGLENFAKELLPLADSKVQGNEILHIEARRQYDLSSITHPLSNSSTFHTAYPCIDFVLGIEADVRKATERLLDYLPQCNKSKPFHALVEQPIWTTWARYKQDITQQDVENFAQEICERGYPHSVLEIDDRWSRKYGDLVFDETKFPHPEKMVQKLHDLGFLVTLWVIPFADEDSEAVLKNDASPKKYFVRQTLQNSNSNDLIASSSFRWWQPTTVKALDVTNPEACEWFLEQLYRLQREYGIDGFKFDAGEPCFLPQHPAFRETLRIPDEYTLYWNCNIASQFPIREVRAASRGCQAYVSFLRLFDKFSVWDFDNGLASIIPATLVAGIVGYPFVLPDIVGGNCYDDRQLSEELFIRWLELSLAMPSVQLSVAPWQFSEDTVKLCRELLTSRKRLLPFIDDAMEQSLNTGWPMIRPLWWTCPQLTESWTIDDEFTVGDNLLVAPVIVAHENDRDIWFPPGTWQFLPLLDSNKDKRKDYNGDIIGPCWLRQFPTPIHIVPCFRRII